MGQDASTYAPELVLFNALTSAATTPGYLVFLDKFELAYQKKSSPSLCLIPEEIDYESGPLTRNNKFVAGERLSINVVLWAPTYDGVRDLRSFLRTITNSTFVGFAEYDRFIYEPALTDTYGRSGTWRIKVRTDLPIYNAAIGSSLITTLTQTINDVTVREY